MQSTKDEIESLVATLTASGIAGIVMGIMRGIIQQKYGSIGVYIRGVLASIFVAIIVGLSLVDASLSMPQKWAVVGLAAYVADDFLVGVLTLAKVLGADPLGFLSRVVSAYRGQLPTNQPVEEKDPK